jgi:UDP:flavonoid glycosyltransferase YjiC (YdhE family)
VEYLGVGMWPGKNDAPLWDPRIVGEEMIDALDNVSLRRVARRISDGAKKYSGRLAAARIIAQMASQTWEEI